MLTEWIIALVGGALIGLAASLLLLLNGRIFGVSGILSRAVFGSGEPNSWRWSALGGLLAGGFTLVWLRPGAMEAVPQIPAPLLILAGLLVGSGTVLGNGCTSGHGVCGISRLSLRSILATLVFMAAGAATVMLLRRLGI